MIDWLMAISIGFGILGLLCMLAGVASVQRRRFARLSVHIVLALACLLCSTLFATFQLSLQGYRALTNEDRAATIYVEPVGPSQFRVTMHLANGQSDIYWLAGDEVYVDAHILKWKPWATLLGLHTAYELDRLEGRYHLIDDERVRPRTVYQLNTDRVVDVFALRRRYGWLESVVDAEYGSAAFFPAHDRASELLVSTTGLLFRPLAKAF